MSDAPPAASPLPRLSLVEFAGDVSAELLHADRGLPYTAAMLSLRPQQVLRGWLEQRDPRYTRPFRYFLIAGATAVALGVGGSVRGEGGGLVESLRLFASADAAHSFGYAVGGLFARLWNDHLQWTLLLLTPFLAVGLTWLHRPAKLNLAESWVCCLYAMGHSLLFGALVSSLDLLGFGVPDGRLIAALVLMLWVWIVAGAVRGSWGRRLLVPLLVVPLAATALPLALLLFGVLFGRLL